MAIIRDMDHKEWDKWVEGRPEIMQKMCRKLPPDRLYQMKSTGHKVMIYSFSEDLTVTVVVSKIYNAVAFERKVFGIDPNDLEECELPDADEPTGSLEDIIDEFVIIDEDHQYLTVDPYGWPVFDDECCKRTTRFTKEKAQIYIKNIGEARYGKLTILPIFIIPETS